MIPAQYLAGFIDGEGSIGIYRRQGNEYLRVVIANTNRDILSEVSIQYGGSVHRMHQRDKHPFWKPCYVLVWTDKAALKIVETVYPYLHIKRLQAQLARNFASSCKTPFIGQRILTEEQKQVRAIYRRFMLALNQRGQGNK